MSFFDPLFGWLARVARARRGRAGCCERVWVQVGGWVGAGGWGVVVVWCHSPRRGEARGDGEGTVGRSRAPARWGRWRRRRRRVVQRGAIA